MRILNSYGNEMGYQRGSEYVINDKYGSQLGFVNALNDVIDKYGSKVGEIRSGGIYDKYGSRIGDLNGDNIFKLFN